MLAAPIAAVRELTRRQALAALGGLSAAAACDVTTGTRSITSVAVAKDPAPGRAVNIEMLQLWGGVTGDAGWVSLAERYEQVQDRVGVRITYAPPSGGGSTQPRLLTAIAGGNPPDVAHIVPMVTGQWASLNAMTDLTDYLHADRLGQDDFLPLAWRDMTFNGRIWNVEYDGGAAFPFFWNKQLFADSGLDPERPPRTIDEVDAMSREINRIDKSGRVTRIGITAWNQYGIPNAIFTWGWAFGGSFYDEKTRQVTPDHEYVVKALEWIVRSVREVGGADKLAIAPPGAVLHPLATGNLGMSTLVAGSLAQLREAVPEMELGATLLPYQPPGETRPGAAAFIGGWSAFVPQGSPHPQEGWDFIRWFAASAEGSEACYDALRFPPTYLQSPGLRSMQKDRDMRPFHDVLMSARHTRPAMEVADFYMAQLDEHCSRAIYGQTTPLEALRRVKENTNRELNRFRRQLAID